MRFHLVYQGLLPSTGNRSKPKDVARIRQEFSPQLEHLWRTNAALRELTEHAVVQTNTTNVRIGHGLTPQQLYKQYPNEYKHLAGPLSVGSNRYLPLVRESLSLGCDLKILFLRQDEAGKLITQGGDLDGRLKCLLDALRMPSGNEQEKAQPQSDFIYCLLEGDELVTKLEIDTDRLLVPTTAHQQEVHLVIEVSIRLLRVHMQNLALI